MRKRQHTQSWGVYNLHMFIYPHLPLLYLDILVTLENRPYEVFMKLSSIIGGCQCLFSMFIRSALSDKRPSDL